LEALTAGVERFPRLLGAGRQLALEAVTLENALDQLLNLRLVVDDEDASLFGRRAGFAAVRLDWYPRRRRMRRSTLLAEYRPNHAAGPGSA
jgi:hypothetical protein